MEPKSQSLSSPKPPGVDYPPREAISLQRVKGVDGFAEPNVLNAPNDSEGKKDVSALKDLLIHSLVEGISHQQVLDKTQFDSERILHYANTLATANELSQDTASLLRSQFPAKTAEEQPVQSLAADSYSSSKDTETDSSRTENECMRCEQVRHSYYLYESECEKKCRVCLICIEQSGITRCPKCFREYLPAEASDLSKSIKYWKSQF